MPDKRPLIVATARGGKKRSYGAEELPEANLTPPPIHDPEKYFKRENTPLIDEHGEGGQHGPVDLDMLKLMIENTNRHIDEFHYPPMILGHSGDAKTPEKKLPTPVGMIGAARLGTFHGRPCMLGDLYYDREHFDEAKTYPFASVERVFNPENPERNFIAAVGLLRRLPERQLGYMTYAHDAKLYPNERVYRYAFDEPIAGAESAATPTPEGSTMPLAPPMPAKAEAPAAPAMPDKSAIKELLKECLKELIMEEDAARAEVDKADEAAELGDDEAAGEDLGAAEEDEGDGMAQMAMTEDEDNSDDGEGPMGEAAPRYGAEFAQPGGGNTFVPTMNGKKKESMEKMAATLTPKKKEMTPNYAATTNGHGGDQLLKYQAEVSSLKKAVGRLTAENSDLKTKFAQKDAEHDELVLHYRMGQVTTALRELDGHVVYDPEKEAKRLLALPIENWAEHIADIKMNYRQTPVGRPGVPVAGRSGGGNQPISRKDKEAFYNFCLKNGITDPAVGRAQWAAAMAGQQQHV